MKKILVGLLVIFAGVSSAMAANSVSKTIDGQNQWTGMISPTYQNQDGSLNVSVIYGATGSATVRLQRTFDGGNTWGIVKTYSTSGENRLVDDEAGVKYRIGVDTGEYFAGTITVRLSN